MSLANYTPSGEIRFGSVPWNNNYNNVRLYTSLSEQYNDIAGQMVLSSSNYVYIARERRLKVDLEADKLYHCNYCMYRNDSLTDGFIYCFVTDVAYVNDHTTEITLETDVFQTYLYGTDWTIPPAFIERETVPSEDSKYLLTNEADFPLVYTIDGEHYETFESDGFILQTAAYGEKDDSVIDPFNFLGYIAKPAAAHSNYGIPNGTYTFYFSFDKMDKLVDMLKGLNLAGSIDSVINLAPKPSFMPKPKVYSDDFPWIDNYISTLQDDGIDFELSVPKRGTTINGYTPRNKKLLYYPYTFIRLTDYNGQISELRYELFNEPNNAKIALKYAYTATNQAFVYPKDYQNSITNYNAGMVINCGVCGSWPSNAYQTWLAQNSGTIALTIGGIALAGVTAGASMGSTAAALSGKHAVESAGKHALKTAGTKLVDKGAWEAAKPSLAAAGAATVQGAATLSNAAHQPTTTRGQVSPDLMYAKKLQQFGCQRVVILTEYAEQIDKYFDRWGYTVERTERVNITSRPSWNYVKTIGAAPKSYNGAPGGSAPFSRGRGTPAAALSVIADAFDAGITFWHTTGNFGDFSQNNSL